MQSSNQLSAGNSPEVNAVLVYPAVSYGYL